MSVSADRPRRRTLGPAAALIAVAAFALCAGPARADGYCGADPTGPTACGIGNQTVTGALAPMIAAQDYYVFFARGGTQTTITINDTENPECTNVLSGVPVCGGVSADLLNAGGTKLDGTPESTPENQIPVPETITDTLRQGVYYVDVETDDVTNRNPQPYSLSVTGAPPVTWPHPCVVPRVTRGLRTGTAKLRLASSGCAAGRVRHVHNRHVRPGRVVRFAPGSGTIEATGAKVTILVSGHHHHHRHHHHRRHHRHPGGR